MKYAFTRFDFHFRFAKHKVRYSENEYVLSFALKPWLPNAHLVTGTHKYSIEFVQL